MRPYSWRFYVCKEFKFAENLRDWREKVKIWEREGMEFRSGERERKE